MTLIERMKFILGLSKSQPKTTPAAPSAAPVWQQADDGQDYAHNTWSQVDRNTVTWCGDSRPTIPEGVANPNHAEFYGALRVPAGMDWLEFSSDVTVTSDDVRAGELPVDAGLRIWSGGENSPIDMLPCYRSPVEADATVSRVLSASMRVVPGSKVRLYLTAFSPAGGAIRFDRLRYSFSATR